MTKAKVKTSDLLVNCASLHEDIALKNWALRRQYREDPFCRQAAWIAVRRITKGQDHVPGEYDNNKTTPTTSCGRRG